MHRCKTAPDLLSYITEKFPGGWRQDPGGGRNGVRRRLQKGDAAVSEELGSIRITDKVIAVCAAKAALDTKGVYGLVSDFSDTIQKNILGKTSESRGVKISQSDGEIVIDLHITVEYGVKIPSVAWSIQERVKKKWKSSPV